MEKIGDRIKKLRLASGYTQKEIADRLGYTSRSSIGKIETNLVDLPQSKIVEFAEFFGVSPVYLLTGHDAAPAEYSAAEVDLIRRFRKLSPDGKSYILQQFDAAEVLFPAKPADLQKEG